MNFYTSISKSTIKTKKWIAATLILTFFLSLFIILFDFIIDPYNVTNYNVLGIKYKFARNDRAGKLGHFKTLKKFDTIMIGSSRVYSINPRVVSDILGGSTYNFGLGGASVEDHLGILKYLKRENKMPKNLIIGVDFYTFNPNTPPEKYFLKNKELNFLSYHNYQEDYLSKLFSIDAFRAAFKTLMHHIHKKEKPPFDNLGWGGHYEDYSTRNIQKENLLVTQEIDREIKKMYSHFNYTVIDPKRIQYYEEIKRICRESNVKIYIFNTPLHPLLLKKLYAHKNTRHALEQFISYLKSFKHFTNLYYDSEIYSDIRNFHGATHTSSNTGDLILKRVLNTPVLP